MNLTMAIRKRNEIQAELAARQRMHKKFVKRCRAEIKDIDRLLSLESAGIDRDKLSLAKTVLNVGNYERGGEDRKSVIDDAIQQISTGKPVRETYGDLWLVSFATKNYASWHGQRSDHRYGYGPKHGYVCFSVGLTAEIRERKTRLLTDEEIEAALYYLVNLERIQNAECLEEAS